MPTCPRCHEPSDPDDEFCGGCGHFLGGPQPAAEEFRPPPPPVPVTEPCPACDTPRLGSARFCEGCAYDFDSGLPPEAPLVREPQPSEPTPSEPRPPSGGTAGTAESTGTSDIPLVSRPHPAAEVVAVVTADRAYFDSVIAHGGADAATVSFPFYCPERRFPLIGDEIRIGRHSTSRGIKPEIDLTGPPEDPGVSHLHAVLLHRDGRWLLMDVGSFNGTHLNDIPDSIPRAEAVPVGDGDRIYVGAWTKITLRTTNGGGGGA